MIHSAWYNSYGLT